MLKSNETSHLGGLARDHGQTVPPMKPLPQGRGPAPILILEELRSLPPPSQRRHHLLLTFCFLPVH